MGNKKRAFFALSFLATLAIFVGGFLLVSTAAAAETVFIAETMANPDGTDGKDNEYLVLKNPTTAEVNLGGYKVCNIKNYCYTLDLKLAAGACGKIFRSSFVFTLYNDEEKISLFDSIGNLKHQVYFKNSLSGKPWICDGNNCDFSLPVADCAYSNIFEIENEESDSETAAEIYSPNANENSSAGLKNSLPVNSNINGSSEVINKSKSALNSGSATDKTSVFQIRNKNDFKKAKKIIQKTKESLSVSLLAQAVIPKNVLGKNVFNLLSEGEWLRGQTYASFCKINNCTDLDVLIGQRSFLKIDKAYLNWDGQQFSLSLGKSSSAVRVEFLKDDPVEIENLETKDLRRKAGKKTVVVGEIMLKKGNYFYVKTERGKTLTLYVPTQILTDWLAERKNIIKGSFPDYDEEKNWPNLVYRGAQVRAEGVIEVEKSSYRVVVTSFRDLNFEWSAQSVSSSIKKEIGKTPEEKSSNNNTNQKVSLEVSEKNQKNNVEKLTELDEAAESSSFNKMLAQKIPWLDMIKIFSLKIFSAL